MGVLVRLEEMRYVERPYGSVYELIFVEHVPHAIEEAPLRLPIPELEQLLQVSMLAIRTGLQMVDKATRYKLIMYLTQEEMEKFGIKLKIGGVYSLEFEDGKIVLEEVEGSE